MNNIGILYKAKNSEAPNDDVGVTANLHLNYWKLPGEKQFDRFVDIGIMIYAAGNSIDELCFYFPFIVNESDLEDLAGALSKDNLLCALFGCDYELRDGGQAYTFVEARTEEKDSFWLYHLDKTNFVISQKDEGTIVEVKIKTRPEKQLIINKKESNPECPSGDETKYNLYIRFRIKNITDKKQFKCEAISNDFIQSAFSKTELIDYHINEKRDFPKSIYEELSNLGIFFDFSKFHFYFIGSSLDEQIIGQTTYEECKLLDSEKWKSYIGNHNKLNKQCIAYHWDVEIKHNKYHIFIRTIFSNSNVRKIIKYLFVILAIGITTSSIFELLRFIIKIIYLRYI